MKKKKNIILNSKKSSKEYKINPRFIEDKEGFYNLFKINNKKMPRYFYFLSNDLKYSKNAIDVFKQAKWYLKSNLTIKEIKEKIKINELKIKNKNGIEDKTNINKEELKSPWINIISTPMRD